MRHAYSSVSLEHLKGVPGFDERRASAEGEEEE
jgi:hypothetical protein